MFKKIAEMIESVVNLSFSIILYSRKLNISTLSKNHIKMKWGKVWSRQVENPFKCFRMFDTNIDNHFSAQTYKNNPVRN